MRGFSSDSDTVVARAGDHDAAPSSLARTRTPASASTYATHTRSPWVEAHTDGSHAWSPTRSMTLPAIHFPSASPRVMPMPLPPSAVYFHVTSAVPADVIAI